MCNFYNQFCSILDSFLKHTIDKNIIIYGSTDGGDFLRWYYKVYYGKDVKFVMDRWTLSTVATIPHLWTLYYTYDEKDIIINATFKSIPGEFNDTGEDWSRTGYCEEQILNLWHMIYNIDGVEADDVLKPEITYYDWLEYKYGIDLLKTVKRKYVDGQYAHGYFPTDFRIFIDGIKEYEINLEKDAVLDIGCGKGSGVLSLRAAGFESIGAVEYTESIFKVLDANLNKLGIPHSNIILNQSIKTGKEKIRCYLGDASIMSDQLDDYNWFFMFNPFSWKVIQNVFNNICKSMKRKPRKIHIFYAEPIGHRLIMESGLFVIKKQLCDHYSGASYFSYIYESV